MSQRKEVVKGRQKIQIQNYAYKRFVVYLAQRKREVEGAVAYSLSHNNVLNKQWLKKREVTLCED